MIIILTLLFCLIAYTFWWYRFEINRLQNRIEFYKYLLENSIKFNYDQLKNRIEFNNTIEKPNETFTQDDHTESLPELQIRNEECKRLLNVIDHELDDAKKRQEKLVELVAKTKEKVINNQNS